MRNKISLPEYTRTVFHENDIQLPENIVLQTILDEPFLKEKEDYFYVGNTMYLYLSTVLFLTGRFAVTNEKAVKITEKIVMFLSQELKKGLPQSDFNLPGLNTEEQEWSDGIIPIIKGNVRFLNMEYVKFLSLIYKKMDINFNKYKGEYLERINMKDARVSNFRVVTCTKELRILFEQAMNEVLKEEREKLHENLR